jgi:15-cis-phytoene synthase
MNHMTSMIRSDALYCERVVRKHARTFTLATYFLPVKKRRASFAFYSLGRIAGDIVATHGNNRKAAARRLLAHRRDLAEALDGRPRGPVFREVRWAIREFGVPGDLLFSMIDGVSRDPSEHQPETWEELEETCEGIATTVGIMCAQVLGIQGGARQQDVALAHARTLGVAMQLTTILRDAGTNAIEGKCRLPDEELARFSLSREDVTENTEITRDPRWHRLMTFEIGRARYLYDQALPGISMLSPDSQRCAAACAIGYAAVLDALEHLRYDSVSARASIGTLARLGVLWEAWRFKSAPA